MAASHVRIVGLVLLSAAVAANAEGAQQNFDNVEITTVPVARGLYMLVGAGGNIGLSVGKDGAFLVDDQFAPLTPKIKAAVAKLTNQSVRFVVNTHWHGDHTGGNENMGEGGAIIVAHENVRKRMSVEQFIEAFNTRVPASPAGALPVITFPDAVTLHWNDQTIRAFHVESAHTDGDAIIHFREANAVHMGDTFFKGRYPFIDVSSGGGIDGMIAAADHVLGMTDTDTKIIPGHGPLAARADLRAYRDMLQTVRDRVLRLVREGKSSDEVVASKPTRDLDAAWGQGGVDSDRWVAIVYSSLVP